LNVSTIAFGSNTTRNNTARFQFNGAVSMPSLSTTQINASQLNASSINVPQINASSITGCLYNSLVSTITTKTGIPGATQQLLNAAIAIYSPVPTLDLTQLFTFSDANYSYWNNNGFVAGNQPYWFARIETLVVNTSATLDFYIGDYATQVQIGYSATNTTYIGNIASGFPQKVRFYFSGGTWYFTNTFTPLSVDNFNSLTINQNISQTSIQTTDALILSTSLLQIYGDTYLNNLTGQYFNVSTMSSLNTYTGQINANALNINSVAANAITTNSITTGSITTGAIITNAPLTVPSISTINMSTSLVRAENFIASTRITTPSISTLKSLNGFNTRLLNNPGNVLVFTQTVNFGNGSKTVFIDTDPFVPGVYTCSAVCRGNQFRTLEATLYYNSRASAFCQNSQGFDNYNGQKWYAGGGFVNFMSQTDGGGDDFDISIYMISGQYYTVGDDPPFPTPSSITLSTATVNYGTPSPIIVGLSTMTGSTITIKATENVGIIAGLSVPTFLGNGTVAINASTNVDMMANYDITLGAAHDINATATSHIRLNATYADITAATSVYGNLGLNGTLYMNNHNIEQTKSIYFQSGDFIESVVISGNRFFSIFGGGSGSYLTLNNGSGAVQIAGDNNLYLVGGGGAIGGVNAVNIQNSGLYFNGTSPIYLNRNTIYNASNIFFDTGGSIVGYSGGTSQGILNFQAPVAGEAGHSNDGIIFLRAGVAGTSATSLINIDDTNIGITPSAAGNIYLVGNTIASGTLNMNSNSINNLSNVNFNAAGTGNLTVDSSYQPSYSASNGAVYGRIPLTQYGTANMRSNVASNVITLPIAYQDTSYVVNVSLNSNAALSNLFISATVLTSNTFAIYQNTTIGSDIRHYFYWITVGQFPTGIPP